jgi:hypothetical protein
LGKAPFSITEIGNYPGHRKEIEFNIPKPSGIHSWKIKASTSIRANEPNIAKMFYLFTFNQDKASSKDKYLFL